MLYLIRKDTMQILILDENPILNARYQVDKHVCKLQTELAQCLSSAFRYYSKENNIPLWMFKSTHEKHPCVLWLKESLANFKYGIKLGFALHAEYNYRYPKNRKYQKEKQHFLWLKNNLPNIIDKGLITFTQAIPEQYKSDNAVESYREYYRKEKSHLFKWTKRNVPEWIKTTFVI